MSLHEKKCFFSVWSREHVKKFNKIKCQVRPEAVFRVKNRPMYVWAVEVELKKVNFETNTQLRQVVALIAIKIRILKIENFIFRNSIYFVLFNRLWRILISGYVMKVQNIWRRNSLMGSPCYTAPYLLVDWIYFFNLRYCWS